MRNIIGRATADTDGAGAPRHYRKAFCQNCGRLPLNVAAAKEMPGDRVLVNKTAYWIRAPQRWEVVVFRLFGMCFIKRVLGLPGDEILVHDGDVYINGTLLRKTSAEMRELRMLVFDQGHAPARGWSQRWENTPLCRIGGERPTGERGERATIVDGRKTPRSLTYREFSLDARKCEPIRDEYAHNGGLHADSEYVRDFSIETEIRVGADRGAVGVRLCDGHDWIEVVLPAGERRAVEAFAWPLGREAEIRKLAESANRFALAPQQSHCIELAFVDRRVLLAVDGAVCLTVDLPAVTKRQPVERPFAIHADGAVVTLERFRLYRDVHYGQQGTNGVRGKSVRLGPNQYFMLGDNSPNSEDSRFWPDEGRVPASALVGSVLRIN
jgi:signal peptidase I